MLCVSTNRLIDRFRSSIDPFFSFSGVWYVSFIDDDAGNLYCTNKLYYQLLLS